jgi:hypothetical protein
MKIFSFKTFKGVPLHLHTYSCKYETATYLKRVFTNLMAAVGGHLRSQQIHIFMYLYDWLVKNQIRELLLHQWICRYASRRSKVDLHSPTWRAWMIDLSVSILKWDFSMYTLRGFKFNTSQEVSEVLCTGSSLPISSHALRHHSCTKGFYQTNGRSRWASPQSTNSHFYVSGRLASPVSMHEAMSPNSRKKWEGGHWRL